jgi:NAD(P)-dependent dehydrogenase (short-subunit alcohol dehydrogenase family)
MSAGAVTLSRFVPMSGVRGVLDGRVAVVTGGASGIGKATVRRFLAEGASVVVGDLNAANGDALLSELDAGERSRVGFVVTDVAEEDAVAQLIATAPDRFGRLDIVFNNAGVGGAFGPITEIEVGAWDRTFAVLVRSVFLGTKHAARVLIDQGTGGSIINTASVAGLGGGGGPQAYSAAKAAVVNLTYNTAVELAAHRVRVNAICPGFVVTPLAVGRDEELAKSAVSEFQPWPDHGQPADIAALALFLASDDSRFVTGEAIRADGALLAAGPRMNGLTDPHGAFRRYTGFADGSTGRPVEKRRLAGDEGDVRPRPAP